MRFRKWICLLLIMLISVQLAGCAPSGTASPVSAPDGSIIAYYLNADEDGLETEVFTPEGTDTESLLNSCLARLGAPEDASAHHSDYPESVTLTSHTLTDGHLALDFGNDYYKLSRTKEVLVRAAIVRTLVQLDGISDVSFLVSGAPLTCASGQAVGAMTENSFVENAGKQINSLQHATITLFFANEDGSRLRQENRSIYYSSNQSLEWAVVERIIGGPQSEGNYPTVPANTQIISISSANGICYVNLSRTFLTDALLIDEALPIYSIANSLIASCEVSQVQFAVEGETDITFRDTISLRDPISSNQFLIEDGNSLTAASSSESGSVSG